MTEAPYCSLVGSFIGSCNGDPMDDAFESRTPKKGITTVAPKTTDPLMRHTKAELIAMIREMSDAIGEAGSGETFAFRARIIDMQRDGFGGMNVSLAVEAGAADFSDMREGDSVMLTDEDVILAVRALEEIEAPEVAA